LRFFKALFNFAVKVVKSAFAVVADFVKESVTHAPAITIMVFSVIGLTGTIALLPIEALFVNVPFITEAMVVPVLAIFITWSLATIAGRTAEPIQ
jgi:hypothetical protein